MGVDPAKAPHLPKRLILCCDGTWMNSDNGYNKPGFFSSKGTLQIPSNVTRISRCFKRRCSDGKLQIISYESGVGTGSNTVDKVTGGAFGLGISERVREVYSYLCANYSCGDEIFLIGFSRGAFTARSVAGMVASLGLLTREGVDHFYPIFSDMQNWMKHDHQDQFPNDPFPDKPKGLNAAEEYRSRLEKMGYTRTKQKNGEKIKIKAVCVWDTWHDTSLSDQIEHAFQALALDESRPPFSPAVWERLPGKGTNTDLRQVWFPGNHGNIGGGWEDQGVANCTLAWMMDQMASVGVEFDRPSLDRIFKQSIDFYHTQFANEKDAKSKVKRLVWAINPIYDNNHPQRPWGLGSIMKNSSLFYWFAGKICRSPGLYRETDPKTGRDADRLLLETNERIHSSVRIRIACKGLGLNDASIWEYPALQKWRLKRTEEEIVDPVPHHPAWDPIAKNLQGWEQVNDDGQGRWVWEYGGDVKELPANAGRMRMVEEPLGPYERYYLKVAGGSPNVWEFAALRERG